jgi:nicotinamidase-related amidase
MPAIPRLTVATSTLVVVDVQDKLLAKIPAADDLVRNVGFLLDAATLLGVEALATEQYPKGLGPTTPAIARRLPPNLPAKTAFSCCGAAGFLADLRRGGRPNVVLVGMETHVCVAQTAFDLLESGFTVFLPVDALATRNLVDHATAVRRLERAGCVPTTAEAVAFEWLGDSTHPQFKAISKLIIDRTNAAGA